LFDQGHRHIAFIGQTRARNPGHWVDGTDPDTLRFQVGVLTTKRRLGLDTSDKYHELCKVDNLNSDAPLRQTLQRLLRLRPAPTALILFDVGLAHQARSLLREWGIHCPSQVSILSRDDCNSDGDITRLASDPIHMGNTAAQHLLNRLSNPAYMATRLLFRSTLIEGQTTARVPQASA
jgi:DNA-binding LacI/PurR family transcriptional regulator